MGLGGVVGVGPTGRRRRVVGGWPFTDQFTFGGQSNINGSGGSGATALFPTAYATPFSSSDIRMLNGGMRPGGSAQASNFTSLVGQFEATGGAQSGAYTVAWEFGRTLRTLTGGQPLVLSVRGLDSSVIGARMQGTAPYTDMLYHYSRAATLLTAEGKTRRKMGVIYLDGENDTANTDTAFGTKCTTLQSTFQADANTADGRSDVMPSFHWQQSYYLPGNTFSGTNGASHAGVLVWRESLTNSLLNVIGPAYPVPHDTDPAASAQGIHADNFAQGYFGVIAAQAVYKVKYLGQTWRPLSMASAVGTAADVIRVTLNVPVPPVVIDFELVSRVGANCGLTYATDGTARTVTGITVIDASAGILDMQLSGARDGSQRVRSGWGDNTLAGGPMQNRGRTNIRDSCSLTTYQGAPCYNWLIHQDITVS